MYLVVTKPKTQTSCSALLPRLFWDKNKSPCKQVFDTMPLLSLINLIISLHQTITSSNTDSQGANRSKLKKKRTEFHELDFLWGHLSHHCHFKYVLKTRGGWLGEHLRWPEPIYMHVGYVFNCVFRQEWFNRFPWVLASSIKNGRTLRKCYLFSFRYKNIWDIDICLKLFLYKKANNFKSLRQIFL